MKRQRTCAEEGCTNPVHYPEDLWCDDCGVGWVAGLDPHDTDAEVAALDGAVAERAYRMDYEECTGYDLRIQRAMRVARHQATQQPRSAERHRAA